LLAKNSDGTVKVGVLADGQGAVVTGAAGMSYNVRKHVAVTKASEANGPVLVPNDGVVSVTTDPAPGSNSRWDVIYILQPLVTGDGGSSTSVAPIIDVAKGTASATPSVPSIPTGALELARVPVPAGTVATSALTFTQGATTGVYTGSDTGWVTVSLVSGMSSAGDDVVKIRRQGDSISLRGRVRLTANTDFNSGQVYNVATGVASQFLAPDGRSARWVAPTDTNGVYARAILAADGTLQFVQSGSNTGGGVWLDNTWSA
jgi:hypothetical protein